MIYVKHMVTKIELSNWGLVYYNNGVGAVLSLIVFVLSGEAHAFVEVGPTPVKELDETAWIGIIVSSAFGLGISFFGFSTRRLLSATAFTVLGCTNKLLTLLVNTLIWDEHASLWGQASLLVCIGGGVAYGEFSKLEDEQKATTTASEPAPEA
jgi:GDP-mannose transporter